LPERRLGQPRRLNDILAVAHDDFFSCFWMDMGCNYIVHPDRDILFYIGSVNYFISNSPKPASALGSLGGANLDWG
jgi:hypothetical protein